MEFKPERTPHKTSKKKILFGIIILLLILVLGVEIYSPIYIKKNEDLDVNAEADRVGGVFYDKDGDKMYVADYKNQKVNDTIIFIHGDNASTFSWRNNIAALATNYHVISFDLLGFGMSKQTKSEDIGLDRSTKIIQDYISENKLTNITVVGHSFGGIVAQKLALNDTKNIIGLILINSLDASKDNSVNPILKSIINIPLIKNPFVANLYNNMSSYVKNSYYDQTLIQKLTIEGYEKPDRYQGSSDQIAKYIKSSSPKLEDISKIKQLTLIYSSNDDKILNKSIAENLSKEISSSTLISIPKAGDLLMDEQPALINEGITKWIQEIHNKLQSA